MSKYTFIREDEDGEINSMQFEEVVWYNVLDRFICFLRGAGFQIGLNSVGINVGNRHYFDPNTHETMNLVAFEKE